MQEEIHATKVTGIKYRSFEGTRMHLIIVYAFLMYFSAPPIIYPILSPLT